MHFLVSHNVWCHYIFSYIMINKYCYVNIIIKYLNTIINIYYCIMSNKKLTNIYMLFNTSSCIIETNILLYKNKYNKIFVSIIQDDV